MQTPSPQHQTSSYHVKFLYPLQSPIHLIDFIKLKQNTLISKITEMQGEQDTGHAETTLLQSESDNPDILFDVCGNRLAPVLSEFRACQKEQEEEDLPKENTAPKKGLETPLKVIQKYANRSPLLDITPSLTHHQQKKGSHTDNNNRTLFLTPKTIAQSRRFDSSHLKNSRM